MEKETKIYTFQNFQFHFHYGGLLKINRMPNCYTYWCTHYLLILWTVWFEWLRV